jgi:hypothetical protein
MVGIEFTYNNGIKDCYDPVDLEKDWYESNDEYIVQVNANTYRVPKKLVKSIRHYELCPNCGYELLKRCCSHCEYETVEE